MSLDVVFWTRLEEAKHKCAMIALRGHSTALVCCCCWCLVAKSCPALCNPMDCSPPGSSCLWDFPARILEWVAISFSRGSSWPGGWVGELRTYFFALSLCSLIWLSSEFLWSSLSGEKRELPSAFLKLGKIQGFLCVSFGYFSATFSPSSLLLEEATSGFLLKLIVPCGKAQVFHLLFKLNDAEHFNGGHGFSWLPFIVQSDLPFSHLQGRRTVRSPRS